MADVSVDTLSIEITAKANSAKSSIKQLASTCDASAAKVDRFAASMQRLSSSLKVGNASGIGAVASAVQKMSGARVSKTTTDNLARVVSVVNSVGDTNGISAAARAVESLGSTKVPKTIAGNIDSIISSLSNAGDMSAAAESLGKLKTSLTGLSELPKSNLSSYVNSLAKLPDVIARLDATKLDEFQLKCKQISAALGDLPQKLSSVSRGLGAVNKLSSSSSGSVSRVSRAVASAGKSLSSNAETLYGKLSKLAGAIGVFATLRNVVMGATSALGSCISASNDYIENMNLADTAMGSYAQAARDYADRVNAALSIDTGSWLRSQGTFMSMAQGMGVAADSAYTMSQGMTQLGYDLSSFFNIDVDEAMQKIESGLSGEIEPMRRLGFDLSETRLQQEAYNAGITESVSNMTQAQKAMLRYKAMLNQITWAQGDMAKTIQSPANMLRVLSDNVSKASRSIGNVFLPMLQAILPVAVAATKVVANIANMIADLTGGNQIASVDYNEGGLSGVGTAAEDAASGIEDAGDAASGTGDKASSAADKVKELKRELMGFDEINKFSSQSDDSSSGSGSGGSGGSGSGGSGSFDVQSYDFIGDALDNGIYDSIMDMVDRCAKALAPLAEAAKTVCMAIADQFNGLDIAGAMSNTVAGAVSLLSNMVRNIIEVIGPLVVAFNFPETIALAFDLAAQMCLTLSAAINAVASMVKGFTDVALVQLAAWAGEKVRDAILLCIEVLQSWQDWLIENTSALNALGQAAGVGASLVLRVAEALANAAFSAAAAAIKTASGALQTLLGLLANSEAARVAATALGAAMTAWALGQGLATAMDGISAAFTALASAIEGGGTRATLSTGKLVTAFNDLKASSGLLGEQVGGLVAKFTNSRESTSLYVNTVGTLKAKLGDASTQVKYYADKNDALKTKLDAATTKQKAQTSALSSAIDTLKDDTSLTNQLAVQQQAVKARVADANVKILEQKVKLNETKAALVTYKKSADDTDTSLGSLVKQLVSERAELIKSTASKGAATVAEGALTVAKGAATVAQTLLNAAVAAFPGMILAVALGAILELLTPVIDGVVDAAKAFFGLNDSTGEVTETTEDANEVLSEEEQQIKDNIESIKEYESKHDNLRNALEASRMSEEGFAAYLQATGQTFDEVSSQIESYADSTVNSFDRISTESSVSADEMLANLESNISEMEQFSANMQTIMTRTGLDSTNSLVSAMLNGGPEKCAQAAAELANASDEELQRFVTDAANVADNATSAIVSRTLAGSSEVNSAVASTVDGVAGTVTTSGENVSSAAQSVDQQTVAQFGSHYGEASDAGRNLTGGFGDGVAAADMVALAVGKAQSVCQQVATALNGGDGYSLAVSAGSNMVGGYGDGIASATSAAVSVASSCMSQVIKALNGGTGYNQAMSAGANLMGGYKDGLSSAVGSVVSLARNTMNQVNSALGSGNGAASSKGSGMMTSFKSGLQSGVSGAVSVARSAAQQVQSGMGSNYNGAYSAGSNEMWGFRNGLASVSTYDTGRNAALSAQNGVGSNYWGAFDAGKNFMYGFNNGMVDAQHTCYKTARAIANNCVSIINSALSIHSPSRVTHKTGEYFSLGLANGIADQAKAAYSEVSDVADGVVDALDVTKEVESLGKSIGEGFGDGMSSALDTGYLSSIAAASGAISAEASRATWGVTAPRRTSHEVSYGASDDNEMMQTIASAVAQGVVSVQMANNTAGTPDTTIVLRVGNEELARAVAKGNDSLARRGVVKLS